MFGGSPDDYVAGKLPKDYSRMSETTVITFGEQSACRGHDLVYRQLLSHLVSCNNLLIFCCCKSIFIDHVATSMR